MVSIKEMLLTASVVALVYLVVRKRSGMAARRRPPATVAAATTDPSRHIAMRRGVYLFFGLMLAVSAAFVYVEWRENDRVIDVRVVNSRTGKTVRYRAHRGDVGSRSFTTVDGRTVMVADVERIEVDDRPDD